MSRVAGVAEPRLVGLRRNRRAPGVPLWKGVPVMRGADWWDERYMSADRLFSETPHRLLVELVSELEPGRGLDVGAGEGRNALWLAERGWDVTAVDFSRVALERARQSAARRGLAVDWVLGDVHTSLPEGPFELVLVANVHPDEESRRALFRAVSARLAAGGRLLVVGRDLADLGTGHGGPPDPERRYTPERLADAFPGVELERCESVQRPVEAGDERPAAVDTLAWGRRAVGP